MSDRVEQRLTEIENGMKSLQSEIESILAIQRRMSATRDLESAQYQAFVRDHGRLVTRDDLDREYMTLAQFHVIRDSFLSEWQTLAGTLQERFERMDRVFTEDRANLTNIMVDTRANLKEFQETSQGIRRDLQEIRERAAAAEHRSIRNEGELNRQSDRQTKLVERVAKSEAGQMRVEEIVGEYVHRVENLRITSVDHETRLRSLERDNLNTSAQLKQLESLADYVKTGNEIRRLGVRAAWRGQRAVMGVTSSVRGRWHQLVSLAAQNLVVRFILYILGALGLGGLATALIEAIIGGI